jgi:macrolide-specific efflux system membrane fusion protein
VAVRSAERALETAQSELRRAEDARGRLREVITEAELERLRLASDQARLTVEKARHELQLAALTQELKQVELQFAAQQVERRQVKAPFAGVVVHIHKPRGSWAEPGDKLLRLVRLDRLRVEGLLDARHLRPNLQGQSVTLAVELPGAKPTQFRGQLVFVSPEIDPFNKQVRVLADIDNPRLILQPGLRGVLMLPVEGQAVTK